MPVAGLLKSSSGRGRSLKELGGLATWLVDPEYSLRSVCRGVKGRFVSTVLKPLRESLREKEVRAEEKKSQVKSLTWRSLEMSRAETWWL